MRAGQVKAMGVLTSNKEGTAMCEMVAGSGACSSGAGAGAVLGSRGCFWGVGVLLFVLRD